MFKKGDFIVGLCLLAVGIGVMLESWRYHLGPAKEPLPGLFPFGAGAMLAILAAVLLIKGIKGGPPPARSRGNLWRPAQFVLGLGVYMVLCTLFGYISAATVFSVIVLRAMETKGWRVIILSSVAVAVGSYLLFKPLLGLPLPSGSLLRWE